MSRMTSDLHFYKTNPAVKKPIRATEGSACFDLCSFLPENSEVSVYMNAHEQLDKRKRKVVDGKVQINKNERALIPTGLIFDIPEGYSVRLHSRSGLAWNDGLYLTNSEGIIDSDYVNPIFVMMTSISQSPKTINNGDRVCQAELVKKIYHGLTEIKKPPVQKTEREGGFGSTGK